MKSVLERRESPTKMSEKSRKALQYNGPDKAEEVETVRTHLQNGRSATGEDSDVGNGWRRSASWKTTKKMVRQHHGLVWMFTARGCMTGEQQTTVETNHWPQRPTWVMSSKEEDIKTI